MWQEKESRFIGTYSRAMDAKGRLLLPPSYLQALAAGGSGSFWLTALYGRLTAYLPDHWQDTVEQICRIKLPSQRMSNFKSRLIGLAQEIVPDSQGRIRIPQSLVREAGLGREVMLVGVLNKFEIWDQAPFDAVIVEDVTDELAASGIEITL